MGFCTIIIVIKNIVVIKSVVLVDNCNMVKDKFISILAMMDR